MTESAVHVGEAARTAALLVATARARGLRWDHLPLASTRTDWSGPVATLERAALGATWLGRLAVAARRHDVVHVHSATTVAHSRRVAPRYVLHCHGTDVRTTQYDPALGPSVRRALVDAEAVLYSTPDLAEHVLPHRRDAHYLPVPVTVDDLPRWSPDSVRPHVVFASRWESVKGLDVQLETARRLVAALGDRADVLGLDWGPDTAAARDAGVRLVPRLHHGEFLRWLAGATAVVGQAAGILSASELEAMGTGAPLLLPTELPLYAGRCRTPPPVLGGSPDAVVEEAVALVGGGSHDPTPGRAWVRDEHGVDRAVDTVAELYAAVVGERRVRR